MREKRKSRVKSEGNVWNQLGLQTNYRLCARFICWR